MAKVRKSHRRTIWAPVLEGHDRDSEKSALQKLRGAECTSSGHRILTKLREFSNSIPQIRFFHHWEDTK